MSRFLSSFLFKLILTVVISIFIGFQVAKINPDSIGIEFKEAEYSFRKILASQPEMTTDNKLQSRVGSYLEEKEGEYSVYVKDLKPEGKRNVCIRCEETFEAASLYKLFLMAASYQAVYEGKLTQDSEISAKMSHLKAVYGDVDFGYESFSDEEVIAYTVGESLDRIASVSDNFAALMLAEKIGWESIQDIADETGQGKTSIQNPITTSSKDVGLFLEKLYNGEIVSLESSEQILDMLTKSKLNNRIPARLPEGVKIAHKTGELSRVRNDAGIVFLEGNPYVIVLMSKNLKGEDEGVENLAEISKIVYEYYNAN
ncbi:serine hydrolase [Candidatus Daviesbacteria bacterium]|nr:serine hydrolase [Candidatus Daviesbacteria bacterium]